MPSQSLLLPILTPYNKKTVLLNHIWPWFAYLRQNCRLWSVQFWHRVSVLIHSAAQSKINFIFSWPSIHAPSSIHSPMVWLLLKLCWLFWLCCWPIGTMVPVTQQSKVILPGHSDKSTHFIWAINFILIGRPTKPLPITANLHISLQVHTPMVSPTHFHHFASPWPPPPPPPLDFSGWRKCRDDWVWPFLILVTSVRCDLTVWCAGK